jgi:hypothetical protein
MGQFPDTLVLPFTSLYQGGGGCSPGLAQNIQQGNTFSVAFDMTQAPHAPNQDGLVTLQQSDQSNFQPSASMQLDNQGLSNEISFISDGPAFQATVFGQSITVTKAWLMGTPNGDVFTWQAAVWFGGDDCIVTNVPMGTDAAFLR